MPQLQLPIFPAGVTEINKPDRGTKRGGHGLSSPRSFTGVPAPGARRAELPHVHQPNDRHGDGEAEGDRADVWRADGHREAVREAVPRPWSQRVLRAPVAPQFGIRAERVRAGASATVAG